MVSDLGLISEVLHPLLRKGGPDQVGCQILKGPFLTGKDPGTTLHIEP
jgi:hypothetical protein